MKKMIRTGILLLVFFVITTTTTKAAYFWSKSPWPSPGGVIQISCYGDYVYGLSTLDYIGQSVNRGLDFVPNLDNIQTNSFFVNDLGIYLATKWGIFFKYHPQHYEEYLGLRDYNVKTIYIDSNDYIYVGVEDSVGRGGGIYRTTDNGGHWEYFIGGIETEHTNGLFIPYNITVINDTLYLMSANGFYYSADNGQSWNMIISDKLDFKYDSPKKIIADEDGDIYLLTDDIYIKEKNDDFNNIQKVFVTNDSISFVDIAVFKYYIFACTGDERYGVYYSTDKGLTFTETDIYERKVVCLASNYMGYMYAGTLENTLYRSLPMTDINDESNHLINYLDVLVFPNPFLETTDIKFYLEVPGRISLAVYNALGYKVSALADEYLDSGNHEFVFDCINLPSGTYYYVLKAGSQIETGKMLLIK
ncbi:T9SS type A sorting domain-containing protein [Bacteroidota bacterium]